MSVDLEWELEGSPPPSPPPAPDPTVVEDYEQALVQLLPRGDAWNLDPEGVVRKLLRGLAVEPARVEDRLRQLLREIDPRTATELLEDWERVLGLPEKCGTPPTSLDARRLAAFTKLTRRPSGNIPFFLQMAADLGYPKAEIRRLYDPPACNGPCNQGLYDHEGFWSSAWAMLPWGTTENDGTLQCLVRKYAQAHEIVVFPEMSIFDGLIFAPTFSDLKDPISELQGVAVGTVYDDPTDSRVFDDGTSDVLVWPSPQDMTEQPLSFAGWVFVESYPAVRQRIWGPQDPAEANAIYLDLHPSGFLDFARVHTTTNLRVAGGTVSAGQWHHIAVTSDGSDAAAGTKLYLDGVEVSAYNVAIDAVGTHRNASGTWVLGGRSSTSLSLNGRITSRPMALIRMLTPAEVAWLAGPGRILFGPWRPIP